MGRLTLCVVVCLMFAQFVVIAPRPARALDQTVGNCTEAGFDAALAAVQSGGGGTITFDCSGAILVSGGKTITSDVTIVGNGDIIFDGNDSTHLFQVNSGANLEIVNLTLRDGNTSFGGAIRNSGTLRVTASTFTGNNASTGGGAIVNLVGGTLYVTASTFRENTATPYGGAIYNNGTLLVTGSTFDNNTASIGGGAIYSGLGMLKLSASTFNNNTAHGGGAILTSTNAATVTASTFSGNSAANSNGGAIVNSATLMITSSTFTGNTAAVRGGAIENLGALTVAASIVALNSATNSSPNCFGAGALTSGGSNLSDDDSCGFTAASDIQNSSAINLGDLTNNGGPTQTMPPQPGSDAIDNAACADSSTTDQRGVPRLPPPATICDIGAVEVVASVPIQMLVGAGPNGEEGSTLPVHVVASAAVGVTLAYAFDCDGSGDYATTGSSTPLGDASASVSIVDCTFPDDATAVGVQVCDTGNALDCITTTASVTITNVAPTIAAITTNAPVPQGQPVTVTVTAADPGMADVLSYSFDCDGNGIYEVAGADPHASCALDASQASLTIGVLVEDDDGGWDSDYVTINQTALVCANRYTGALSAPAAHGSCPSHALALTVPGPDATTFCINLYTAAIIWAPRGTCGAGYRTHLVPDDGPLYYCQSLFTGQLRYTSNGNCGAYERPGVIPA